MTSKIVWIQKKNFLLVLCNMRFLDWLIHMQIFIMDLLEPNLTIIIEFMILKMSSVKLRRIKLTAIVLCLRACRLNLSLMGEVGVCRWFDMSISMRDLTVLLHVMHRSIFINLLMSSCWVKGQQWLLMLWVVDWLTQILLDVSMGVSVLNLLKLLMSFLWLRLLSLLLLLL